MADFNTLYEQLKASAQSAAKSANTLVTMMTADENTDVGIDGFGLKPSFSKQLKTWTQPLIDQMSAFLDQSVATFYQFLVTSDARVTQFLQNSGYQVIGDYTDGPYTLGNYNSAVKYDGSLYKLKSDTDVPFTTTGTTASSWANDSSHFYAIDGDMLSQQLASDLPGNGSSLIGDEVDGTVKDALVRSRLNTREIWRRSLAEAGLTLVSGSFEEGATVSNKTDVVWYIAGGQCYFWDGAFPKVVPVGSTPASTGGIATGAWQLEASATLRSQLADAALVERNGVLSTQDHISIRPYILTTANHTDALQAAINAIIGEVAVIDLGMTELEIATVNVTAAGKSITFRNGKITVAGVSSKGFSRVKTDTGTLAKYDMSFDNVHFVKSDAGGSCIEIDIAWQDATGGVDINSNCSFNLTNGAIGIRLKKSFGNNIRGRYLMDSTSTAILCDSSEPVAGDTHPQCPMETVVDDAMFSGGIGFDQLLNPSSSWNSFEGFSFGPGVRFYDSKFKAKKYNGLKLNGVHGVSWNAELDSGFNTSICGGYYDKQNSSDWIFKFLTTVRSSQGIVFSGGAVISAQGNAGNMVIFTDDNTAASAAITCVILGDVYLISGDYSPSSLPAPSRGFWFDHALLSHVSVSSSLSFQAVFACLSFNKPINRSVINGFDARETVWYAESVAIGYSGGFNRFDGVYREIDEIELMVPTYISTGVNEPVFVENIFFENMMRPPIATVSNIVSTTGAGEFTITVPLTYRNGLRIYLIKNASAPGGARGAATAKIVLDSSKYLAPL